MNQSPSVKPWYQSKLFWTGIIIVLTAILGAVAQQSVTLQDVVVAFLGGLVAALRLWFTNEPTTQPFMKKE
jgi:hypothetical protein